MNTRVPQIAGWPRWAMPAVSLMLVVLTLGNVTPASAQGCDPADPACPTSPPPCGVAGGPTCEPPPDDEPADTPRPRPTRTPIPPTATPSATATETPTGTPTPTATAVPCDTKVLTAILDSLNEVPSVPSGAVGSVKLLFDLNAGSITGNWEIPFAGSITAAHIHNGPAGVNAAVFIPFSGLPIGGSFATLNSAPVAKLQDVLNNPAAFYVNVHTQPYPRGEIRGQLVCAPASEVVASPTPTATATSVGGPVSGGGAAPWLGLGLAGILGGGLILGLVAVRRGKNPGPISSPGANPGPSQSSDKDPGPVSSGEKDPGPININRARSHPANHSGLGSSPEPIVGLQAGPDVAPQSFPYWNPPETSASPGTGDGPTATPGSGPTGSPSTHTSATPDQPDPEPDDEELE